MMSPAILDLRDEGLAAATVRNRGPKIIGIACGFLAASMVVGLMRLALRTKRRLLAWDDACIAVGLAFSTLQSVAACLSATWGYGHPIKSLSSHQLSRALFWFYIAQVAYKGSIWPAKISILILYNRVFGDSTHRVTSYGVRLRTSLVLLITFAISFWLISEIVTVFTCVPVQHYWDKTVKGECHVNTLAWWFTQSILNTVSDIFILVLPMPLIKDLQIPKQQKISLMLVFALGLFVTVCTVVRMTTFKTGAKGSDATYDGAVTLIWSLIETNIAIICACLPLLRPLISRIIPAFGKTSKSRSKDRPPNHRHSSYYLRNLYAGGRRGRSGESPGHDGTSGNSDGDVGKGGVSQVLRKESWDWKDGVTTVSTGITNHKSNSDESQVGMVDYDHRDDSSQPAGRNVGGPGGGGGVTGVGGFARAAARPGGHPHHYHRDGPFGLGGITKQTDVDITTETASEHGSQRRLTACGSAFANVGLGGAVAAGPGAGVAVGHPGQERGGYRTPSL